MGRAFAAPVEIDRIDLRAHRRSPWKIIRPPAAGAYGVFRVFFASRADAFAYSQVSWKTHLYLVEGAH